ncbi:MAG: ACT domain-containing protein [Planctomycetota bacterium]|jgi:ACT domain-containing protein
MAKQKPAQVCIVTITGADKVGIIAKVATAMARANINIIDVNQKIMEDCFVMTMAVDITRANIPIKKIKSQLDKIGSQMDLNITLQDENIFKAMHRV